VRFPLPGAPNTYWERLIDHRRGTRLRFAANSTRKHEVWCNQTDRLEAD
jgi:hypothetical protein